MQPPKPDPDKDDMPQIDRASARLEAHVHKDGATHIVLEAMVKDPRIASIITGRLQTVAEMLFDDIPNCTSVPVNKHLLLGEDANSPAAKKSVEDLFEGLKAKFPIPAIDFKKSN